MLRGETLLTVVSATGGRLGTRENNYEENVEFREGIKKI